jgi:hypothetical protein
MRALLESKLASEPFSTTAKFIGRERAEDVQIVEIDDLGLVLRRAIGGSWEAVRYLCPWSSIEWIAESGHIGVST